jgi:hypothetical protein
MNEASCSRYKLICSQWFKAISRSKKQTAVVSDAQLAEDFVASNSEESSTHFDSVTMMLMTVLFVILS